MPERHGLRRPTAEGLLLLQLSLVTLSGFHYHAHDPFGLNTSAGTRLQDPVTPAAPTAFDWLLCPVCQIIRLSAARPATLFANPQAVTYSFFVFNGTLAYSLSQQPASIYGRAPPPL